MVYYNCSKGNKTKKNKKVLKPLDKQKNIWYNKHTNERKFEERKELNL